MVSSSLDDLELVATVIAAGTLAGAARRLKVTPSAISKQLARLEERLGVRLVERTTRQLRPTAAGLRYGAHAATVVQAVEAAEDDARAENGSPRGTLTVSAPLVLGQEVLAALVAAYLARYPDVRVDLRLEDRHVELVRSSSTRCRGRSFRSGTTVFPRTALRPFGAGSRVVRERTRGP